MRNPPNYGSVVDLGANRRKPYAVRVPIGKKLTSDKREIMQYKYIGYFERSKQGKQQALQLLADYNAGKNVSVYLTSTPTFKEVAEQWLIKQQKLLESRGSTNVESNLSHYRSLLNKCHSINDKPIANIKYDDIQRISDSVSNMSQSTVAKLKALIYKTFDLARKQKYIPENFIDDVDFFHKYTDEEIHTDFSEEEIKALWTLAEDDSVKAILIMIYTGLRTTEFLQLKTANIHLEDRYMIGGMKTDAGTDRIIPISKKIEPFIKHFMLDKNEFLLTDCGRPFRYDHFVKVFWTPTMRRLNMNHKPHDTRYTTATLLDRANANPNSIKDILGHAREGITNKVYVQKNIQDLIDAIDKI